MMQANNVMTFIYLYKFTELNENVARKKQKKFNSMKKQSIDDAHFVMFFNIYIFFFGMLFKQQSNYSFTDTLFRCRHCP